MRALLGTSSIADHVGLGVGSNRLRQQAKNYTQSTSTIPVGRWTQTEVFYRRSNQGGGRITLWQDGLVLFDLDHVQTALGNEIQVSVDNYGLEVEPGPVTIYVDDVTISTQRIGQ